MESSEDLGESYGKVVSALQCHFQSFFCGSVCFWEVEGCCFVSAFYDG